MAGKAQTKQRHSNSSQQWPWFSLNLSGNEPVLEGRSNVRLSRHVINLRGELIHLEPETKEPVNEPLGVNFVSSAIKLYSPSEALSGFLFNHPVIEGLSLVTVLEVVVAVADIVWHGALWFFLKLASEVYVIFAEIQSDVREFVRFLGVVFGVPWRVLTPARATVSVQLSLRNRLAQTGGFFVLALFLVLPLKGIATWNYLSGQSSRLTGIAQLAAGDLRTGGEFLAQGQTESALTELNKAREGFAQARQELGIIPSDIRAILGKLPGPSQSLTDAEHLLKASESISTAAALAAERWNKLIGNIEPSDLKEEVAQLTSASEEIRPYINEALQQLGLVREQNVPVELRGPLTQIKKRLSLLEQAFDDLFTIPLFLRQLLVTDEPKTYVVLFQNNTELRPTGGFAGSLALIKLENGKVESVNIPGGGPYDFQGSLQRTVRPPEPLRLVRGTWQLQDANWFYDFPTSAEKVLWFIKESGGPEAQGVMALTTDVVQNLLKLTGPLEMPTYDKVITADNFLRETQEAVELEYDRAANRPKQFIADLAPALLDRLMHLPPESYGQLTGVVNQALGSRGVQLYVTDQELEQQVASLGWAGNVKETPSDYLAIVRTNIGGGKTDGVIREKVRHTVNVATNGDITVQLSLTREHTGNPADIFTSRRNVTYLRFYVPQGSTLLGTDGFTPPPSSYLKPVPDGAESDSTLNSVEHEIGWHSASGTRITDEFGKTVFANWLTLDPGESRTVTITYKLPFKLTTGGVWQDLRRYSVLFQRQAGVEPMDFVSVFNFTDTYRVRWQESSEELNILPQSLELRSDWDTDQYYGVVMEKTP